MARIRTQTLSRPQGFYRNRQGNVLVDPDTILAGQNNCEDTVAFGDCDPLDVTKWYMDGCVINKPYQSSSLSASLFVDYIADACKTNANWPHLAVDGLLSDSVYALQAAARSNPSRPYVDVPVNILELGDVVSMIRNRGAGIITDAWELIKKRRMVRHARNAARTHLLYQFGIAPVVDDLFKLIDFQEQVARRVQEIERLRGPKGLRRTIDLGTVSGGLSKSLSMQSNLVSVNAIWEGRTVVGKRAHIRWNPEKDLTHLDNKAMRELAKRAVLGISDWPLGLDLMSYWEAVPWSWLVDWGTTLGDYLKSERNIIPATLRGVWIHTHSRTEWTTPSQVIASGLGTFSGGKLVRERKQRSGSVPITPTAHFPFLSGKQVGILGSLSVLRRT